ncbi:efflux RND transporter periplasmic adaptor subunit [Kordiimonas sp.]|uniref:efflux RND transporter periplasmic adaptor subunit n=1 Tax=Kordiimonas sp. TaxID=1970157 RepID=UPI003A8E67DC
MIQRTQAYKLIGFLAVAGVIATMVAVRSPAQNTADSGLSRALPVRTVEVTIEEGYRARRTFTGRAVPGRVSAMAFELGGTVAKINVDLGSTVKTGDVLAELDTARLQAQRAQLLAEKDEVAASLDLAERTFKRAQETFKQGHASAQRLDEAEANAISLRARFKRLEATVAALDVDIDKASIKAPFSGVITSRMLDEGVVVSAGKTLLELSEDSHMEAHIGMPPEYAAAMAGGAPVELRGGRRQMIEGATVRAIVPSIEGQTRTMMVTFNLPANAASRGELVTAVVSDWQNSTGAWLPIRALSSDVRGLWRVYKVIDGGEGPHVRFENVQVLYTDTNRVFVTGTISNGDRIITDGVERLAPDQRVTLLPGQPLAAQR